jgi:hypothetical protein
MDKAYIYEIRLEGQISEHWSGWFEGLEICNDANGETTLKGRLADQAALFGVLSRIHALNLNLIAVRRSTDLGF